MHIDEATSHLSSARLPDLDVRFVHGESCSEAFVRRLDRQDADGYELRLKSWDDSRTARVVIERNLIRRVLSAYDLKARLPDTSSDTAGSSSNLRK